MCIFIWLTYGVYKANAPRHYLTLVCSVLYQSAYVFLKKSGACSGRVPGVLFLLQFFKKILGRVPGVLFLLHFFTKILGRVPGVFSHKPEHTGVK